MTGYDDITEWHRRLCTISEQIIISGDLSEEIPQASNEALTSIGTGCV
jgi:hypothetical protein